MTTETTDPQTDAPTQVGPAAGDYPDDQGTPPVDQEQEGADPEADATDPAALEVDDLPPILPPNSWAKDAKEQFVALPREAQEIIAKRETERDRFVEQKAVEASRAKEAATQEARQVVLEMHRAQAAQLQQYAQMFETPAPDISLLQSGNEHDRALYYQQDAMYRSTAAQREQAQREADAAQQQAAALEQHELQQQIAEEHRLLEESIPEWSEPSSRQKLLTDLQPIGAELGYSPELMSQARAQDIIALKRAMDWRSDAEKYRSLMRKQMATVRAGKQPPLSARSGVPQGQQVQMSTAERLYPDDVRR